MAGVGAVVRRGAVEADLPRLREIWDVCFPEDVGFNGFFFREMYSQADVRIAEAAGRIAGAMYLFDYKLMTAEGVELDAVYVYGVGTHPDFRGMGVAGRLISETLDELRKCGRDICMLVPQDEGLFRFYERFGFKPAFALSEVEIRCRMDGALRLLGEDEAEKLYELYELALHGAAHVQRDLSEWQLLMRELSMYGGGFYLYEPKGIARAYVAVSGKNVIEVIGVTETDEDAALRCAAHMLGGEVRAYRRGGSTPYGSACPLSDMGAVLLENGMNVYMNLMHS